jgi:hypothetical protein
LGAHDRPIGAAAASGISLLLPVRSGSFVGLGGSSRGGSAGERRKGGNQDGNGLARTCSWTWPCGLKANFGAMG